MGPDAIEIRIHGIVQGVGFRPNVFRLARHHDIAGTVTNTGEGVFIRAQGLNRNLKAFINALKEDVPALARITGFDVRRLDHPLECSSFSIEASSSGQVKSALVSPDVSICDDCLRELFDPDDRRYLYPFINCTNCGPRYSIIRSIPYDRPNTSMGPFIMCEECDREYHDPMDRRFHAQPDACWECGPRLSWHKTGGEKIAASDVIEQAVRALSEGRIVALKGLGGFHLAVDACNDRAVSQLRQRKGRPHKPLAIMVEDLEKAKKNAWISSQEARLLSSRERPIVLLKSREGSPLSPAVSPGIGEVGIMLPYTPLHYLLFRHPGCPDALVMTSGNLSGQPICRDNSEALEKLGHIADYFLLHNRDIVTRVDDSVARVAAGRVRLLRRARGFAPAPVRVPWHLSRALACGPEMKNTFCLSRGHNAFLSQHLGDLQGLENLEFFEETVKHLSSLLEITPEFFVCDLHPDYLSTRYARAGQKPVRQVQHHLAHAAAVVAEHGLVRPVIAIVMDGTGFGTDGTIWGGEIFQLDPQNWGMKRLARLLPMPLPGGDMATKEPWRMGMAALFSALGPDGVTERALPPALRAVESMRRNAIMQMIRSGVNTPATSSAGRLFDAVAAILGVRLENTYEAQAAMELTSLALKASAGENDFKCPAPASESPFANTAPGKPMDLDWRPLLRMVILRFMEKQVPPELVALEFHINLVRLISSAVQHFSRVSGIKTIVLCGGCMNNRLLLEGLFRKLAEMDLELYSGEYVPVNDGGISLGQVVAGGTRPCV